MRTLVLRISSVQACHLAGRMGLHAVGAAAGVAAVVAAASIYGLAVSLPNAFLANFAGLVIAVCAMFGPAHLATRRWPLVYRWTFGALAVVAALLVALIAVVLIQGPAHGLRW